jgi:glycyl-tRNA synthetase beta chain
VRRKLAVLPELTDSADFTQLATLFKRVKNIARNLSDEAYHAAEQAQTPMNALSEPAELALVDELRERRPVIERAVVSGDGYRKAFAEAAAFGPAVARFFEDVMVMADNPSVRDARLRLMRQLEALILQLADVSEMVPQSDS